MNQPEYRNWRLDYDMDRICWLTLDRAGESANSLSQEVLKELEKIIGGLEKRNKLITIDEKAAIAYHEAGHALVSYMLPNSEPVQKITIIPRGRALGVTMFLPEEDRYSHSKKHLESQISSLYSGRLAEELIFGLDKVTTGAQNDIQRATEIARSMVTKWGLSDLGPLKYGEDDSSPFLGRSASMAPNPQ